MGMSARTRYAVNRTLGGARRVVAISLVVGGLVVVAYLALVRESDALNVFLAALLAFGLGEYGRFRGHARERRARAESLMVALRGEIRSLRASMRGAVTSWGEDLKMLPPRPQLKVLTLPRNVFQANAGHLGDVGSAILVEQIVETYKAIDRLEAAEAAARARHALASDAENYARIGIAFFQGCTILEMKLRTLTAHLESEDYRIVANKEDETDSKLVAEVLGELDAPKSVTSSPLSAPGSDPRPERNAS